MRSLLAPIHHPIAYCLFILVATLDLLTTSVILSMGGREANAVAAFALTHGGPGALIALKFAVVMFVVMVCEMLSSCRPGGGRRLAEWAVAINCIPLCVGGAQLAVYAGL